MFDIIQFDVSGICNAKCSWCISGKRNRNCTNSGSFMSPELFRQTVRHLKNKGFITPPPRTGYEGTWLALYMWGDPFLHPKIKEIISIAHEENVRINISTNGSKKILFDEPGVLSNVRSIWFSMPGFSQTSYDKSHGFNFETIKRNITEMTHNFYKIGKIAPHSVINIFHMYQYNLLELPAASEFAQQNKASFWPYCAYFADPQLAISFLKKELPYDILDKASRELFLSAYKGKPSPTLDPSHTQCTRQIYLDEFANAVVCCNAKHIKLGSIFDMTPQDYIRIKKKNPESHAFCQECHELGISSFSAMPINSVLPIQ